MRQVAYAENLKLRELEEKRRVEKEKREKAERDKKERAQKRQRLTNIDGDQEGVMDNLLEALNSGAVFSSNNNKQRRKQNRNTNPGKHSMNSQLCILFVSF